MTLCSTCGKQLPNDIPGGFCPFCMLAALEPSQDGMGAEAGEADNQSPPPPIPGHRLLRRLGEGGMGVVWLAEQQATGRLVVVKYMRARHGPWVHRDALARARFRREIALAARLDHPHLARVIDGGESEGVPYCVMEFIDGLPLTDYAIIGSLDRRQRLAIVKRVAEAVAHAHRLGVIHRDLKPSNILIDAAGDPHLLDFGLAKALETQESAGATLSLEGMEAGTPSYMSPEQAAGHLKQVDTRTDVYALGVLLYQLLTVRLPHDGDGAPEALARRVADTEILRPRSADPSTATGGQVTAQMRAGTYVALP